MSIDLEHRHIYRTVYDFTFYAPEKTNRKQKFYVINYYRFRKPRITYHSYSWFLGGFLFGFFFVNKNFVISRGKTNYFLYRFFTPYRFRCFIP